MRDQFPDRIDRGVRRVVTGIDAAGRSVVVSDARATGDPQGLPIWGADQAPVPGDPVAPVTAGWWPPPGGIRVTLSSRKPDRIDAPPPPSGQRDWPDIDDAAGFHASTSTDIIVMIAGTIWLELDDGVEVRLSAGDVLVQNGTRHRWRNHGTDWPIMAVVIVGAQR